jgi:hypothetical protein
MLSCCYNYSNPRQGTYHISSCHLLSGSGTASGRCKWDNNAVYSRTYLKAQVLAALDVHTAKHIVEKCFSGDLIKGRTIILVVCSRCSQVHVNNQLLHIRLTT